jgi:hypothetical protein
MVPRASHEKSKPTVCPRWKVWATYVFFGLGHTPTLTHGRHHVYTPESVHVCVVWPRVRMRMRARQS